jgi:hypothetical protein
MGLKKHGFNMSFDEAEQSKQFFSHAYNRKASPNYL